MQEFLNTKNREGTENLAPKPHLLPKPKGTASERVNMGGDYAPRSSSYGM